MSIECQKQPLNDGAHPYTTFGMASDRSSHNSSWSAWASFVPTLCILGDIGEVYLEAIVDWLLSAS